MISSGGVAAVPLLLNNSEPTQFQNTQIAWLDVFRCLSVFLMILVDYGGCIFPIIAHAPWNGIHLADFIMPFFLFIAGISLSLVYKKRPQRTQATWKALAGALKLFALGGYFHGVTSFTFGVDIQRIRCLGILQIVAALCEIWLPAPRRKELGFIKSYYRHWFVAVVLLAVYSGLLYGLYVPDWQFDVSASTSSLPPISGGDIYTVRNIIEVPLSYHRQWRPYYPTYVLFDYNGSKHFVRVWKYDTRYFFADELKEFMRAHDINVSVIIRIFAPDKNTSFDVDVMGPIHRQSRGRSKKYIPVQRGYGRRNQRQITIHDGLPSLAEPWFQYLSENNLMVGDEVVFFYRFDEHTWEVLFRKEVI
ncbi:hypothetical protein JHK82_040203 [Glycine max]|nr:hypothetical protein JHK82_040203 [Glycine max]KAG5122272.1 hypothetical protein JHK84_040612 [Glycine max]